MIFFLSRAPILDRRGRHWGLKRDICVSQQSFLWSDIYLSMKMEPNSANLRAAVAFPIIRGGFFLETFLISFLPSPKSKAKNISQLYFL